MLRTDFVNELLHGVNRLGRCICRYANRFKKPPLSVSSSSACVLRPIDLHQLTSTEQVPGLPIPLQCIPGQIPHFKSRSNLDHYRLEVCNGDHKASRDDDDDEGDRFPFRTCRKSKEWSGE